jgi:hypothetical protein
MKRLHTAPTKELAFRKAFTTMISHGWRCRIAERGGKPVNMGTALDPDWQFVGGVELPVFFKKGFEATVDVQPAGDDEWKARVQLHNMYPNKVDV